MSALFHLRPVGHVRGGRAQPLDDAWDRVVAAIELTPEFGPEALAGLDGFSTSRSSFFSIAWPRAPSSRRRDILAGAAIGRKSAYSPSVAGTAPTASASPSASCSR